MSTGKRMYERYSSFRIVEILRVQDLTKRQNFRKVLEAGNQLRQLIYLGNAGGWLLL